MVTGDDCEDGGHLTLEVKGKWQAVPLQRGDAIVFVCNLTHKVPAATRERDRLTLNFFFNK